uniref:Uncharacterized protein n=1 Tax=Rhizophora mucronata TaxID=61149 RepID=A0A2P2QGP2_RHIMU
MHWKDKENPIYISLLPYSILNSSWK